MQVTLPARSVQECQLHVRDPRRDARTMVGLRAIVADKLGLASGEVTNMSLGGCGLRLTKRLRRGQYLSLIVYPNDRTAAVHIDLGRVTWVEGEWAVVEFLCLLRTMSCIDSVELSLNSAWRRKTREPADNHSA